MSILSKVFPTSASVWVLWQLIQPRVLGIWKTIAPRQNSSRPTILWLSFLNQCNSVLKSQDLTNGNLVLVYHQKKKNSSRCILKYYVSWGPRTSHPFGQCLSQALLLCLPVELHISVWVSVKPAADAELRLYEGHNGLSITATPA